MKKYLLIRNKGLAPIESFTILGLSTSRGEGDKIGQFGSGSKHGILNLLRNGIEPRIFIGKDELKFTLHPATMGDKDYSEVRYSFRGEQHKTGMCLEFGALDWSDPTMSLREFICNALDQGEEIDDCTLRVNEILSDAGETRVFIPLSDERVMQYAHNMRDYFLHFDGLEKTEIFPSRSGKVKFFRRGVFVREVPVTEKHEPMFTYNFQDGRIDESRNLDGSSMSAIAAKLLLKSVPRMADIMRTFGGEASWEHSIGSSLYSWDEKETSAVLEAWKSVHGDNPCVDSPETTLALTKKGISHVVVPTGWASALRRAGIQDGRELLSQLDRWGGETVDATEAAMQTFLRAWAWIESVNLTNEKPFPQVKCFTLTMEQGAEKVGYYKDGTVFLNLDYDTNEQAAIEELAHYITGAGDETRDFQDYAFKLATRLAKMK